MNRAHILGAIFAAATLMPFVATADDRDGASSSKSSWWWGRPSNQTITGIVAESGGEFDRNRYDYDILLNAVLVAGLDGALDDRHADLTVFAPNDRAFIRLARDFGYRGWDEAGAFDAIVAVLTELGNGDPIPVLTNILLYHVSPDSKFLYEVIYSGGVDTLLEGATILPYKRRLLDNEPDVRDPFLSLFASDIRAANGIIHTISRVLIPIDIDNTDDESLPTITGLVAASGGVFDHNRKDFDILLTAVLAAGLQGALDNPDSSLSVLAPNDAAFIRTARQLGYHGRSEAGAYAFIVEALTELGDGDPIPLLTAILKYHVLPDALTAKGVLESDSLATLLDGATIHPDSYRRKLRDNDPALRDPQLLVYSSDIRASNGFVHTITRVLIPVDLSTL